MLNTREMSIIITGGCSGLGFGMAKRFSTQGAKVTICGRREDKVKDAKKSLGDNVSAIVADITKNSDRKRLIQAGLDHGGKINALINNAGNMYRGSIDNLDQNELLNIFNTNVVSGMMLLGESKKYLAKTKGVNIFIGSVHNRRAFPGASPYAATKGALETLTKVLAAELGNEKIRVNCVVPGGVYTEINQRAGIFDDDTAKKRLEKMASIHALGRIGTPEEIAEAVEYLICSEWTTGAILDVDGGLGLGLTNL
ncbi:SDR family oxidoreductase [Hyphomicrobiales bacterium]|jgi:NAD(P)-dependent dehydrogenase (short-subunit alcohol dehydrogenase family)|nr:SDR family oxidoreductase [Hyphomicrobiales bacterium]MDG1153135.1 SDR family NAD(P)-dependent oxidoreductase [Hyphomicrobiales bacterium]MDG1524395.1 SDR family NAD(P)-dependent oxidoreductase [Hyphomicrobiales bacterium]MDG1664774.1 SDR family NAD(P)-dependent oxidoreductase [Hyphomicrobiales bacterium]MDG2413563.1 SDR family NAD(P)-dependent oxidoreductase [Hyphomicrobiales bacterium]|tara:strand:- start:707 stop:1468 length:762 start_codon:yes stop_codon:yes gene_type:complete